MTDPWSAGRSPARSERSETALFFDEGFSSTPLMGIFRGHGVERTLELCEHAWAAGVTLVEVPVMHRDDLEVLEVAVRAGRERGLPVGAGTILTVEQLEAVVDRGAAFSVSPGLESSVIRASERLGVPHLPGVATSTEIASALVQGLSWLKAFPAAQLSADWVRAQRGPFPYANFVATGGVGAQNAADLLDAGCRGLAVGSSFDSIERVDELLSAIEGRSGGDVIERRPE